jgi:hypothetical protein
LRDRRTDAHLGATFVAWNAPLVVAASSQRAERQDRATASEKAETITETAANDDELPRPIGPAPPETVALWCKLVTSMGPDELDSFERRTFAAWERASLGDLLAAIRRRRRELFE